MKYKKIIVKCAMRYHNLVDAMKDISTLSNICPTQT